MAGEGLPGFFAKPTYFLAKLLEHVQDEVGRHGHSLHRRSHCRLIRKSAIASCSRFFGSPDKRQIDRLGAADPLTSKSAIIAPPSRADANIDYTFALIGI